MAAGESFRVTEARQFLEDYFGESDSGFEFHGFSSGDDLDDPDYIVENSDSDASEIDEEENLRDAGFQRVMTVNRYEKLSQYLHCNHAAARIGRNHPDYHPIAKVAPVVDMARQLTCLTFNYIQASVIRPLFSSVMD
uniref:Uncharacterized protein n=1 Tax=Knipowitschia caucasica TaxID=637954 RepID=A0AAV2JG63_KNICA